MLNTRVGLFIAGVAAVAALVWFVGWPDGQSEALVFTPAPESGEYGPQVLRPPATFGISALWEFSLPENTIVGAADAGFLLAGIDPKRYVIQSLDGKWGLVHESENIAESFKEVLPNMSPRLLSQGDKLFRVRGGDNALTFSVLRVEGDCLRFEKCLYADPEEYFQSRKAE